MKSTTEKLFLDLVDEREQAKIERRESLRNKCLYGTFETFLSVVVLIEKMRTKIPKEFLIIAEKAEPLEEEIKAIFGNSIGFLIEKMMDRQEDKQKFKSYQYRKWKELVPEKAKDRVGNEWAGHFFVKKVGLNFLLSCGVIAPFVVKICEEANLDQDTTNGIGLATAFFTFMGVMASGFADGAKFEKKAVQKAAEIRFELGQDFEWLQGLIKEWEKGIYGFETMPEAFKRMEKLLEEAEQKANVDDFRTGVEAVKKEVGII